MTDAQFCPCGMANVILVKFPTPVTEEVSVTSVGPVSFTAGASSSGR